MSLSVEKALRKAQSHIKAGELAEAEELYKQVLSRFPKNKKAIQGYQKLKAGIASKGSSNSEPPQEKVDELISLYKQGQYEETFAQVAPLISLFPKTAFLYHLGGLCKMSLNRYDEAIKDYKQAIKNKPDYADAYYNMGLALMKNGELNTAIESFKQAIKIKPDFASAYNNIGAALKVNGELDAAIENYRQAIKIKPDYAEAYKNMGTAMKENDDIGEAIKSYRRAIKIKPDYAQAHRDLAFALLQDAKLMDGLIEYEWRWRTADFKSQQRFFTKPIWDGVEDLKDKTVLIWGEQGPQDMTIWSSCLPYISSRSGQCILECPDKLAALFIRSFPNVEVRKENRNFDADRADFDFHLPMGSLFRHFTFEISKDAKPDAFLISDPVRVNFWRDRLSTLGQGNFVGISWKSPVTNFLRAPNYTQISDWAPVFALKNVTFINLQSSDFEDDLTEIQDKFGINVHNFDDLDHYNDLQDVTALCAALDMVVSVSTAVSALAAGVGTPTKMLHWRQSPWNNILLTSRGPSVDVFERNTWEPWDDVFQSVAKEIADFQVA